MKKRYGRLLKNAAADSETGKKGDTGFPKTKPSLPEALTVV